MSRQIYAVYLKCLFSLVLLVSLGLPALGQSSSSAAVNGIVQDTTDARIPNANVKLINTDTGTESNSKTSKDGNFAIPSVLPGHYRLQIERDGFDTTQLTGITLNVGDNKSVVIRMKVGSKNETVTVDGSGLTINTTDGSVSTVVDRQFVADIPLNGRSFQDLISMTPGVVTASPQSNSTSPGSNGDFSINGQRTDQNYYMVDGVAANVTPASANFSGYGPAGVTSATSALGTTQSLLSVDDLQEFRVESSSYSAEYGRSPGGQLTFATRSGTNTYHGSAYDYFRNGSLDANDWFNDRVGEPKQELHQNDFGGTIGGPIWIPRLYKGIDRTFFFVSYEGLRVMQPFAATTQYVPDIYLRQQAPAVLQPLLNAYPLPSPGGIDYGTKQSPSLAQFFQGYSLPGRIDSTSARIDHTFTPALSVFFRFADTPSSNESRLLSALTSGQVNVQTYTFGATNIFSPSATNQLRLGYSRSYSGSSSVVDTFGGAVPLDLGRALGSTTGVTGQTLAAYLDVIVTGVGFSDLVPSAAAHAQQHQWNLTDTLDIAHGTQHWKFGLDFRPISSFLTPHPTIILGEFIGAQSVLTNSATFAEYGKYLPSSPVLKQFALFAQDDWRINSRLSLSGGLRWEVAPPLHNANGPQPYTLSGNLGDPSTLSLAPPGTPLWHTPWFSFAPRLGIAWQAHSTENMATVVRAGGGVFFDTSNETAIPAFSAFGNSVLGQYSSVALPLTPAQQDVSISTAPPYTNIYVYPSHLQFPYTLGWNTSVEQQLGRSNALTISYIGSAGRRVSTEQEQSLGGFNPLLGDVLSDRGVTSDYDALQAKFQRNVSKGLNALVAYTWSHSIDYGSNSAALSVTRGNSDFDVRNNFQGGVTWELPKLSLPKLISASLNGWSVDGRLLARSGYPITLQGNVTLDPANGSIYYGNVNVVANQPIYLHGSQYPGGRSLNPSAFAFPTGTNPGNAPRNFARGLGESQVNFAARREFSLSELVHLQFRAEAFNIFNHPNFGYVDPILTDITFGQATQMLNQSLGTVASQYQQGGPRSMQFALRLAF